MCQKVLERPSLPRRDVGFHVATSKLHFYATSRRGFPTSRRHFNTSVTLRRVFSRRVVILHKPLSRRDVIPHVATWIEPTPLSRRDVAFNVATLPSEALCHVATSPRTSRCDPVFSPRMVHFGPSPHTSSLIGTLAPLYTSLHWTCRSSLPTGRRPSTAHRPPVFPFESPFSAGFES